MYRIIVCALLVGATSAAAADTRVHTAPQTQSIFAGAIDDEIEAGAYGLATSRAAATFQDFRVQKP